LTKPFCAHFAQFLSSLAFDKKATALRRSFLVPTFVYRHRPISHLLIRMPVSSMTELPRRAGRVLSDRKVMNSRRAQLATRQRCAGGKVAVSDGFSATGSSCTTSGFGTTYVTSGEYQCSRFIETRIGIKRGA